MPGLPTSLAMEKKRQICVTSSSSAIKNKEVVVPEKNADLGEVILVGQSEVLWQLFSQSDFSFTSGLLGHKYFQQYI